MRTSRLAILLSSLVVLAALPAGASANCYSIYDAQNRLAFQSTIPPIDLSARISDAMRTRFPGNFLVILPDDANCLEFRSGPTVSPRFDSGTGSGVSTANASQTLEPPLLRGARAPVDSAVNGNPSATRDVVRSGNVINLRRGNAP